MPQGMTRIHLLVALLAALGAVRSQDQSEEVEKNYPICAQLLDEVKDTVEGGAGLPKLEQRVHKQQIDSPSGPYVLCCVLNGPDWKSVEWAVHPNAEGVTHGGIYESLSGEAAETFANITEGVYDQVLENMETGKMFNFSYPYNQTTGQLTGSYADGALRQYVAYPFELDEGNKYGVSDFYCVCPFTDIPQGPRNNSLAELQMAEYLAEGPASWAAMLRPSLHAFVVLAVVIFRCA